PGPQYPQTRSHLAESGRKGDTALFARSVAKPPEPDKRPSHADETKNATRRSPVIAPLNKYDEEPAEGTPDLNGDRERSENPSSFVCRKPGSADGCRVWECTRFACAEPESREQKRWVTGNRACERRKC